ncbi:hypothetical protein PanWU01x14_267450, partial [Parasponia andersonii]
PLLHKARMNLILQVINLLREIKLWSSGLNIMLLTKRNPPPSELGRLGQRVEKQHRSTIVRYVTANLLNRVICGQDRQNRVRRNDRRLLEGVDRTNEHVDRSQPVRLALALEPDREPVQVGLPSDGVPFGELIENPGEGEPDLADHGDQPERESVPGRSQDPEPEEEAEDQESEHDDDAVRTDQARRDRDFSPEGLSSFGQSAKLGCLAI